MATPGGPSPHTEHPPDPPPKTVHQPLISPHTHIPTGTPKPNAADREGRRRSTPDAEDRNFRIDVEAEIQAAPVNTRRRGSEQQQRAPLRDLR